MSKSHFFYHLQYSCPYVLCCFVGFPGDTEKIGSAMKFVSLWYEMEPKQGVQLVHTQFVWFVISDCFGHLCYRSFAQCPEKCVIVLSSSSLYWAKISLSLVFMVRSISWVNFTYWINLLHQFCLLYRLLEYG